MRAFLAHTLAFVALLGPSACLDTTPQYERGRVVLLAPYSTEDAVESVLATLAQPQAQPLQVARYGTSEDLATAARRGEGQLIITAHPAYADLISGRVNVLAKAPLVSNAMFVVGPASASAAPAPDLSALLRGDLRSIALPPIDTEPLAMYAREAMLRYGIWSRVQPLLREVAGTREALDAVRGNSVDAAFAFASDVTGSGLRVIATVDPAFHQLIVYEVLLLDDRLPAARQLFDYLVGPDGINTFIGRGFLPLQ